MLVIAVVFGLYACLVFQVAFKVATRKPALTPSQEILNHFNCKEEEFDLNDFVEWHKKHPDVKYKI